MILSYARVSTSEQAADGTTSLSEQQRHIKNIAQMRGAGQYDVALYVDKGVSGSIPLYRRPEGARMLHEAKAGDCIIAAKLDRLFRSVLDGLQTLEDLVKRNVDVILADLGSDPITGNGISKVVFSIMTTFAEFERERIAERMRDGREAKRQAGMRISGHAPYGFRFEGEKPHTRLVPCEDEIKVIRAAADCWKKTSPAAATDMLNDLGLRDRAGNKFRITQVTRLVERAKALQ